MREYSFTEARQNFASILEEAKKEGADLGLSSAEIVELLRKGRERRYNQ